MVFVTPGDTNIWDKGTNISCKHLVGLTQKDALHHFKQTDPHFEVSNLSNMFSAI